MKSGLKFTVDRHIDKVKEALRLPDQFCNTCTLREGTIIVIICLQVVTILFIAAVAVLLWVYPDKTDDFWLQKFKDDFDPYIMKEEKELIAKVHSYWRPVTYAVLASESFYFVTGFGVIYALWKKHVHPGFYLPWLTMTGFLVTANFLTVLSMVVYAFGISSYRETTVTWDMVPTIICFVYACIWFYGFVVVLGHYKRRMIVKWWRDHGLDLSKPENQQFSKVNQQF